MFKRLGFALVVVSLAVFGWVANCSGPDAEVTDVQLREPGEDGGPYVVDALVKNTRRGTGQVSVTFELRNEETSETYRVEEQVQLESKGEVRVTGEVDAPEGRYRPEVRVEYPPR